MNFHSLQKDCLFLTLENSQFFPRKSTFSLIIPPSFFCSTSSTTLCFFRHSSLSFNTIRQDFYSCQDWRTVNNNNLTKYNEIKDFYISENLVMLKHNMDLLFSALFSEQISLEPARILNFLASDSICKYQNRQTNLLNCMDLTQTHHNRHLCYYLIHYTFSYN